MLVESVHLHPAMGDAAGKASENHENSMNENKKTTALGKSYASCTESSARSAAQQTA